MTPAHLPRGVHYRNLQVGWPVVVGVLAALMIIVGVAVIPGREGMALFLHPVGFASLALLAVIMAIFGVLRTEITDEDFIVAFGPGWPRRITPLYRIRSVRLVRNHWLYGWGIRLTPHGWLWNASGLHAVEIELDSEGGKRFRVGTDDPLGLAEALAWAADVPIVE